MSFCLTMVFKRVKVGWWNYIKKAFFFIYVGEWVLFFYVLLLSFVLNMTYYANITLVDSPWEEPTILPFVKSLLVIFGIGIICFLYIYYLKGNVVYRMLIDVIWLLFFGSNLLSCLLWFSMSYQFELTNNERILLIAAILVSLIIIWLLVLKYRNFKNEILWIVYWTSSRLPSNKPESVGIYG